MPKANHTVRVARADESDAAGICRAHKSSVAVLCASHYTPKEIEAWIGTRKPDDYLPALRTNLVLVAVARGRIAGFTEMQRSDGLLRALYVHPGHARCGIGTNMLNCLEKEAAKEGWTELRLNATLNSVAFYLNRGYQFEKKGTNITRTGVSIPCVHMLKRLEQSAGGAPTAPGSQGTS